MDRRVIVRGALAAAVLAACGITPAGAQEYPNRPITLVVPHPAGGTSDILARTISVEASKTLGQQIVVENKGGGNGTIAAKQVATAAPNGYTLLLATASTHGINPTLYPKISYDALRDFTPQDRLGAPAVAIVNEEFARRVFGGGNPVGRRFTMSGCERCRTMDTSYPPG